MNNLSFIITLISFTTVSGLHLQRYDSQSTNLFGTVGLDQVAIPTTTWCCVFVVCQYMVVYLALFLVRTCLELLGEGRGVVERALSNAAQTLTYGPMLCVLFIACRLRVEFLSDGKGSPQWWVQGCMYMVTFAVFAQTLSVLFISLMTGKPLNVNKETGDIEVNQESDGDSKSLLFTLTSIRYGLLVSMYGGLLGIIVGIFTYLPPGASDLSKLPPPAPSVMCTMQISVLFFAVQLVVAGCRSYSEFKGEEVPHLTAVMVAAANTVEFGPMMAILFISLRMRAIQHDAEPQAWAQDAMYFSTTALTLTTFLAIVVPLLLKGKMVATEDPGNPTFEVPNKTLGMVLVAVRYVCMMCLYGGVMVIFYAIITFRAPAERDTLPISPTMECVMSLTTQYFLIYFLMILLVTASELSGGRWDVRQSRMYFAVEAAKGTLAFAPMLAILFVTVRMYALLLTDGKGSPQKYCQEGMFMATYALLVQCVVCLLSGLFMGKVDVDSDGNVVTKLGQGSQGTRRFPVWAFSAFMLVIRYIAVLMLYGGISTVVFGVLNMTPENANGLSGLPVTPIHEAPPNPGDLTSHLA